MAQKSFCSNDSTSEVVDFDSGMKVTLSKSKMILEKPIALNDEQMSDRSPVSQATESDDDSPLSDE